MTDDQASVATSTPQADGPDNGERRWRKASPIVLAFTSLAFIAAVVFGILWVTTVNSDEYKTDVARDQIVAAARKGVMAFYDFDSSHLDQWRQRQKDATTSKLYSDTGQNWDKTKGTMAKTGLSAKTRLLDAGVYQLNLDDAKPSGTAMVAAEVTTTVKSMPPNTVRMRFLVPVQKENDQWRISDLQKVPETGAG